MKKSFLFTIFLLAWIIHPALCFSQSILLSLPDTVIAGVVQKCLPFEVTQPSESLAGRIFVDKVENLVFSDESFGAAVTMRGQDVQLNTSLGAHQVRLNVGNIDFQFSLKAALRFDKASQTLFIRPIVSEIDQQGSQTKEVGELVGALFSDKEFPIALDNLQPIITDLGNRELIIDMVVEDIHLTPTSLDLLLTPTPSVKPK